MRRPGLERHYRFISEKECHVITLETLNYQETVGSCAVLLARPRLEWLLSHPLMEDCTETDFTHALEVHDGLVHRIRKTL